MSGVRWIMARRFEDIESLSVFGDLIAEDGIVIAQSVERNWVPDPNGGLGGKPSESCFPAGFYAMVPHGGDKYGETVAFVGQHVSQLFIRGIPRYACVAHWSMQGRGLQGCVSWGEKTEIKCGVPRLIGAGHGKTLIDRLRSEVGPHYLTVL